MRLIIRASGPMCFAGKDGKSISIDRLLVKYNRDVKAGWTCKACGETMSAGTSISAKAPPGWSDSNISHLPDSVDNKWALAWWLHNERGVDPKESSDPAVRKRAKTKN